MLDKLNLLVEENAPGLEAAVIALFRHHLIGRSVSGINGNGRVAFLTGNKFKDLDVTIAFNDTTRKFALASLFNRTNSFARICDFETGLAYQRAAAFLENYTPTPTKEEVAAVVVADNTTEEFKKLLATEYPIRDSEDFYKALGWFSKRISNVIVVLPKYLEELFLAKFGADVTYKAFEEDEKLNRWSIKLGVKLNSKKQEQVPEALEQYVTMPGRVITDEAFILELVFNYGFKLNRQQDTDAIFARIPEAFQEAFTLGLTE